MKDFRTAEVLDETVMYDNDIRIVGAGNVIEKLRTELLPKAKEFGGKNLETRMFTEAFEIRGPSYGDVVRQIMRELHSEGKIRIRDIGTKKKPRYLYDVI